MSIIVGLHQSKDPTNLANVRRTVSCYGGGRLFVTGGRMTHAIESSERLPRPLRDRRYENTRMQLGMTDFNIEEWAKQGFTPVAIEVSGSQNLAYFEHPHNAFYIFGPEDGSLPPQILSKCHAHVVIPTLHCLNLAVAVSTVLYDRMAKTWTHMENSLKVA